MRIKYGISVTKFMFSPEAKGIYDDMKRYAEENSIMVKDRDGNEHPIVDDLKSLERMSGGNQLGLYAGYIHLCAKFKLKGIKEGER